MNIRTLLSFNWHIVKLFLIISISCIHAYTSTVWNFYELSKMPLRLTLIIHVPRDEHFVTRKEVLRLQIFALRLEIQPRRSVVLVQWENLFNDKKHVLLVKNADVAVQCSLYVKISNWIQYKSDKINKNINGREVNETEKKINFLQQQQQPFDYFFFLSINTKLMSLFLLFIASINCLSICSHHHRHRINRKTIFNYFPSSSFSQTTITLYEQQQFE